MKTKHSVPNFKLGKKNVGKNSPVFIIGEIGINYDGERKKALKLISVAAKAGVDAVKFQIFKSKRMYSENAGSLIVASGDKVDIHDLIKKMELPYEWLKELKSYAEDRGVEFFASVCDEISADALFETKPCAFKIASYEITHLPLLEYVTKKKLPIVLSCGGATMLEVSEAIQTIKEAGGKDIVLMHCISQYDVPLTKLNLNVLKTLQLQFPDLVIGYSDHSAHPTLAPVTAVALGAKVIEKHITLDKSSEGPDHSFALEPDELAEMVQAIREAEQKLKDGETVAVSQKTLGSSERMTFKNEVYVRKFAYRLLYATQPIKVGDLITTNNIAVLRSGENYKKYLKIGLHPRYYKLIVEPGVYRAQRNIKVGQAISWNDILAR
ncbi:MAG: spore coat polysaccharide biosynthesis protein SpsE [Patescibacteria group bacterium]|nr:MAG: spore coat polysaccharide biosynthesis protein SpsE [Patescibacteria group bacterium]